MKAMLLEAPGRPLRLVEWPRPQPAAGQLLLAVRACGVCRTDLHVFDGELWQGKLPLVLGHEIVGRVVERGAGVERFALGQRVGVPWLGRTCGRCPHCARGTENLCAAAEFTGYTLDGGYAEFALADQNYCFALPDCYSDTEAAPLLCAGLIGYRSLMATGEARRLGIYGFGAAAHIVAQVARWQGREIYAFTKPGDLAGQDFARQMGAHWAGGADAEPPDELDAAIIFAPAGELVPQALRHTAKGGTVVCAGIHMSDIPAFPYAILWGERCVRSIANLTRRDGEEFFAVAPLAGVRTEVTTFPLAAANEALQRLRTGQVQGAAVLVMD
ncbi:MAG TPA: zinc-dependent alcohol dehydrogenase family protein [Accumulibacter sp.]|uniref:zinc-dependent alcohol dehydrogenase family protein n=1 Tax=Accumulibacter sp. TaxID=2053492 RepID=UPI0028787F02|nr:zinc-dependent alcohol dehydrogenase family protein [Accumulibacter sp.]MDS4056013.1 zinc-dependent alcohol dehydrogenase family protein [Accumulibacter sp.]HMV04083.1 zinc-dependent alcohol dehydrogenase family protein [Accumulibacter sp.]HMW63556.1 zinc-dependent alcohol dehydrogenase family protein [Accumulibacter sp.]HMX68252.1 zinc-dependent alcohol dehydrogenase family protein [Accumulibacter sp.]HNG14270.1 zinc-dependent alcohol dehydrogenase family protein [Accumulibacter sp.]